jgi:hypothetical protein
VFVKEEWDEVEDDSSMSDGRQVPFSHRGTSDHACIHANDRVLRYRRNPPRVLAYPSRLRRRRGVHNLLDPTSPSTSLVGPGWISPRRLDFPRPRFAAFFKGGLLAAKPRPLRHTAAPLIGAPFRLAWTCPTEKRDGLLLISFQEQALGSFGREVALVVCLA